MASWGYGPDNGPSKWYKEFPVSKEGKRQSPINIVTESVVQSSCEQNPIKWVYDPTKCLNVENTGSSWKVNVDGKGSNLQGGCLNGEYELWQFHAHWGKCNDYGSEHTVNDKKYAAELHLVHWNRTKYSSPNIAAGEPDGLAVLGLLMEVGSHHAEFQKLVELFPKIQFKGEKTAISAPLDPAKFLPVNSDDKTFYTYEGSLTTPPLLESVIWHVFKKPIQISQSQMDAMRNLQFCGKDAKAKEDMVDNYRPPLPLGSRVVRQM